MLRIVRTDFRDAETCRNRAERLVSLGDSKPFRAERHAEMIGNDGRRPHGRVRENHGELFARMPRGEVTSLQVVLKRPGHFAQHRIAHGMAIGVIHRLELVEIQYNK